MFQQEVDINRKIITTSHFIIVEVLSELVENSDGKCKLND